MTPTETLIFSVGLGGYGHAFRKCIASQERYAKKYGHDYISVEEVDGQADLGMSAAWLKIPMIMGALARGYKQVLFIDADIEITADTPDIIAETESLPQYGIFGVLGHSSRINSGVILARNNPDVYKAVFTTRIAGRNTALTTIRSCCASTGSRCR